MDGPAGPAASAEVRVGGTGRLGEGHAGPPIPREGLRDSSGREFRDHIESINVITFCSNPCSMQKQRGTLEASPQRTTVTTHDIDLDHEHGAVLMDLTARLQEIANAMWMPVIELAIVRRLYFTIRTKVLQIRLFPQMLRELKGDGDTEPGGLTPFQALALTIGNRVGVGNIAGVATAIGWGGPGALFWMGVMAFCGGATAFVESTLAQIFKERINNELKGGVPYYLHKVFQKRWIGMIAAVTALLLYTILAPGIQSNSIAVSFE